MTIDAFFGRRNFDQFIQVKRLRLIDEAADFDRPGPRDEIARARRDGFFIGRKFVEIIIMRNVLIRRFRVIDHRHGRARRGLHFGDLFAHGALLIGRRKITIKPAGGERRCRQRPAAQEHAARGVNLRVSNFACFNVFRFFN